MNKRKAKKLCKKLDVFAASFASSYREVRMLDREYHEYVIASNHSKRNPEEIVVDFPWEINEE